MSEDRAPLRIDMEVLTAAMQFHMDDAYHALDLQTGEILMVQRLPRTPEETDRRFLVEGDAERFLGIPAVPPRDRYRWMREFAERWTEGDLYDHLVNAMQGRGAVGRFMGALQDYPRDRDRWTQYEVEQVRAFAEEWLKSFEIAWEAAPSEGPAWGRPTASSPP